MSYDPKREIWHECERAGCENMASPQEDLCRHCRISSLTPQEDAGHLAIEAVEG